MMTVPPGARLHGAVASRSVAMSALEEAYHHVLAAGGACVSSCAT